MLTEYRCVLDFIHFLFYFVKLCFILVSLPLPVKFPASFQPHLFAITNHPLSTYTPSVPYLPCQIVKVPRFPALARSSSVCILVFDLLPVFLTLLLPCPV